MKPTPVGANVSFVDGADGRQTVLSIESAFELYRSNVVSFRSLSKYTEINTRTALNSLLFFIGEDKEITKLCFEDVRDWKEYLEKQKKSRETIRGYLVRLRAILSYLRLAGYPVMPPELIILPRQQTRAPEVLTPYEVTKLIKSAKKTRDKAIISLLYSTGLRVYELCSLTRSQIKEDFFNIMGKGDKSRLCFIDPRSRKLITKYLDSRSDDSPSLFLNRSGDPITPHMVQEMFQRVRCIAELDQNVHPHTMRHSFATNLMRNGAHLRAIQELMGHSSIKTTQIYLHIYNPELKDAFKKYHTT